MAATRQLTEFTYQSGANASTAYTFIVQVDGGGNAAVREIKSPTGLIVDNFTIVPKSVTDDITAAIADVESLLAISSAVNGTASFVSATSQAVVFGTALGSANYRVHLSVNDPITAWVTSKTTAGFTIQVSATYTGSVGWDVFV